MKRVLIILVASMALFVGVAQAQWHGAIDPVGAPDGSTCVLPSVGFFPVYAVGRPDPTAPNAGFWAVEFDLDVSAYLAAGGIVAGEAGAGTTLLGNIHPGPGVQVGFATCQSAPVVLLYTVNFFLSAPVIGTQYVAATVSDLATATAAMAECSALRTERPVQLGVGVINGTCDVGTEETTWGKLKALYGE